MQRVHYTLYLNGGVLSCLYTITDKQQNGSHSFSMKSSSELHKVLAICICGIFMSNFSFVSRPCVTARLDVSYSNQIYEISEEQCENYQYFFPVKHYSLYTISVKWAVINNFVWHYYFIIVK